MKDRASIVLVLLCFVVGTIALRHDKKRVPNFLKINKNFGVKSKPSFNHQSSGILTVRSAPSNVKDQNHGESEIFLIPQPSVPVVSTLRAASGGSGGHQFQSGNADSSIGSKDSKLQGMIYYMENMKPISERAPHLESKRAIEPTHHETLRNAKLGTESNDGANPSNNSVHRIAVALKKIDSFVPMIQKIVDEIRRISKTISLKNENDAPKVGKRGGNATMHLGTHIDEPKELKTTKIEDTHSKSPQSSEGRLKDNPVELRSLPKEESEKYESYLKMAVHQLNDEFMTEVYKSRDKSDTIIRTLPDGSILMGIDYKYAMCIIHFRMEGDQLTVYQDTSTLTVCIPWYRVLANDFFNHMSKKFKLKR